MNRVFYSIIPLAFANSLSAASILTFEGGTYYDDGGSIYYSEGDFVVAPTGTPNEVSSGYLDDRTSMSNTITLSTDGLFNAESIDLDPVASAYTLQDVGTGDLIPCVDLCQDVSIIGYRDGVEVAHLATSSSSDVYDLGSEFHGIDAIEIKIRPFIRDEELAGMLDNGYDLYYGEISARYDNLTVAAVPIPAAGFLLLCGLFGLGLVAHGRRA